jgi:hypothetical protein
MANNARMQAIGNLRRRAGFADTEPGNPGGGPVKPVGRRIPMPKRLWDKKPAAMTAPSDNVVQKIVPGSIGGFARGLPGGRSTRGLMEESPAVPPDLTGAGDLTPITVPTAPPIGMPTPPAPVIPTEIGFPPPTSGDPYLGPIIAPTPVPRPVNPAGAGTDRPFPFPIEGKRRWGRGF